MKICDYCGREFKEYDLKRIPTYRGKVRYMCYRCRALGNSELKKLKVAGMEKKGLIGDK